MNLIIKAFTTPYCEITAVDSFIIATLCLVSSIIGYLQFSFGFLAALLIFWIEE
jgi:hypothetical protein